MQIDALPASSEEQLAAHNDVCAICYQAMIISGNVRVTRCKHIFHGTCLRKWLYVQEKCPMCSTPITTAEKDENNFASSGEAANNSAGNRNDNKPTGHDHQRKVHFNIENHSSSSSESNEGAEDSVDAASSQEIAVASTSFTNQNFDTLLTQVQLDVRLAKLRGKQVKHSRSKSESLARILE